LCIIAREVSGYRTRFEAIEKRLDDVEREHHEVGMERARPSPGEKTDARRITAPLPGRR